MGGNTLCYTYKCPHCEVEIKRDFKALTHINCDFCKASFDADKHWISSSCIFTKEEKSGEGTYWIGGIQMYKGMSFETKIEAIARRFKPEFIEYGHGYAVLRYDLAHTANMCHNLLVQHNGISTREEWMCDKSGNKVAIVDNNFESKNKETDDGDNKNESYAG
jgi:hypothetical protein